MRSASAAVVWTTQILPIDNSWLTICLLGCRGTSQKTRKLCSQSRSAGHSRFHTCEQSIGTLACMAPGGLPSVSPSHCEARGQVQARKGRCCSGSSTVVTIATHVDVYRRLVLAASRQRAQRWGTHVQFEFDFDLNATDSSDSAPCDTHPRTCNSQRKVLLSQPCLHSVLAAQLSIAVMHCCCHSDKHF